MKQFLMGNQILALAAKDAGAKMMFGYPITPSTEILETWISYCSKQSGLSYLQTEDEMAAGFATIGACLAGVKAFTATAGPGNVLMQDAFSMAEAQRIPIVSMIMQRGGLSTSTVIYSQEEIRLTCFGGNGEGFRVVYSTSNLQELYDYTLKAFTIAWKYRWPTFILADGYQGKMVGGVNIHRNFLKNQPSLPILKKGINLRNCFNFEEEIGLIINQYQQDYEKTRKEIEEYELIGPEFANTLIIAHGIVASACKPVIAKICAQGKNIALFRPITLRPFPKNIRITNLLRSVSNIIVLESALGQLADLFKKEYYFHLKKPIREINKPAMGFTPEEIYDALTKIT
jgi:2-oxoglutarate ferredoxin oxidoreductase subunit alpha